MNEMQKLKILYFLFAPVALIKRFTGRKKGWQKA